MKKLLLAVSIVLAFACKTSKSITEKEKNTDSIKEMPKPGVENQQQYDSLKNELDKRRKEKR